MNRPTTRQDAWDADKVLAARCVEGDRAAQRELWNAYRKGVHATLYRLLGSNAPMDDLLQETFVNVFRALGSYRGDAALGTWIHRCAIRVAYAHIAQRRRSRPPLELLPDVPSDDPSAEQRALAREATRHFHALLEKMEPKQRIAFALHVLDERPMAEVASVMGATLVATQTRVWRGRRALEERARKDPTLAVFLTAGAPRTEGDEP